MTEATVTEEVARARRRPNKILLGFGAALALVVCALLLAKARGRRDWPTGTVAAVTVPAAVATDPAAWPAVRDAMAALPEGAPSLTALRESQDLAAIEGALGVYQPSLALLARATERGGFAVPAPATADAPAPSLLKLMKLADAWALRARVRAARGDVAGALGELAALERFAARATHTDNWTVARMLGFAVERRVLDELPRMVTLAGGLDPAATTPMERALAEAQGYGTSMPALIAGECAFIEGMIRAMDGQSSAQLFATVGSEAARPGLMPLPASWLFDAERTLAAHRQQCRVFVQAARGAPGARPMPARVAYRHDGAPWELVDNPLGRVLLSVATPSFDRLVAREDDAMALRAEARVALAIARFRQARGASPTTLSALSPEFLPTLHPSAFAGREARWDAAARELRVTGLAHERSPGRDGRYTFAP